MFVLNSRLVLLAFAALAFTALVERVEAKKHRHCKDGQKWSSKKHHCYTKHVDHDNNNNGGGNNGGGTGLSLSIGGGGQDNNRQNGGGLNVNIKIGSVVPPKGKAGVAGGDSLKWIGGALSWFIDWTANPDSNQYAKDNGLTLVPMLWGAGRVNHDDDWQRMEAFKKLKPGQYKYVAGFNEADWEGNGSSGWMDPKEAARLWDQYLGPHKDAGSLLISPSCAKQKDEDWMGPFLQHAQHKPDIIAVHIFQDRPEKVKAVLDHYAQYGLPMFITEVACINYQVSPAHFCSQQEVNDFIWGVIQIFENDDRVAGYAISDANNGPNSPLTANHQGQQLTETGNTLLTALKKLTRRSLSEEEEIASRGLVKRSSKWSPRDQHTFDAAASSHS